jgi:nitronate monooxygenase/enoyl-[acyl-carrier protein] reductase II
VVEVCDVRVEKPLVHSSILTQIRQPSYWISRVGAPVRVFMSIRGDVVTLHTELCTRLGIRVPLVQAPIGPAATPELAAAVSNAGALGMLSITWVPPQSVSDFLRRARELTVRPLGVNVILDFPVDAQIDAALDAGIPVVSTFWGDPAPAHDRIASGGALHLHTVGSADEARRAVDAGVDVVVAQGWEAGGHVCGTVATLPLVPAVVDAVAPVPVIAAGGIADGRGLAAVLMLGAQAAWLGSRFLLASEASSHEVYQKRLIAADADDSVHTRCFDGGWPNAAHRVLRNATVEEWDAAGRPAAPNRPGEGSVVGSMGSGGDFPRYTSMMPLRGMQGGVEEMALYAGQSIGLVREIRPAAAIVEQIVAEAEATIGGAR